MKINVLVYFLNVTLKEIALNYVEAMLYFKMILNILKFNQFKWMKVQKYNFMEKVILKIKL